MIEIEKIRDLLFSWVVNFGEAHYPELNFILCDERGFPSYETLVERAGDNKKTVFIVFHFGQSTTDNHYTILDAQIQALSEDGDFDKARAFLVDLVKNYNLSQLPSSISGYVVFGTPGVTDNFVGAGPGYRSLIYVDASFVVSPGISTPVVKYNNQNIFLTGFSLYLNASNDPLPLASTGLAKTEVLFYTRLFSFVTYCDTRVPLVKDCLNIWLSQQDTANNPANKFNLGIDLGTGESKRNYKLTNLEIHYVLGQTTGVTLVFTEAN